MTRHRVASFLNLQTSGRRLDMASRSRKGGKARHGIHVVLGELEPRLTPSVTTAALSGGLITIVSDNGADFLVLTVTGSGAFALTNSNTPVPITGSPTIANVN